MTNTAVRLSEILRNDMREQGFPLKKGSSMAPAPKHDEGAVQLPRVSIDFKVPLWSLVVVAAIGVTSLVAMYYQLQQVGIDVNEMKSTVRTVNSSTIQLAQDLAVLKFRMDKLEQERSK